MPLPAATRERLAAPLQAALQAGSVSFREVHTIPLPADTWNRYSLHLIEAADVLADTVASGPLDPHGFDSVRVWVSALVRLRDAVLNQLECLQPFRPFDHAAGLRLVASIEQALTAAANSVTNPDELRPASDGPVRAAVRAWKSSSAMSPDEVLRETFGLKRDPLDVLGEFAPSAVFASYPYRMEKLLACVLPHLVSLGVDDVVDVLAGVCVVGWIVASPDPVAAYRSMKTLLADLRGAPADLADAVTGHLDGRSAALRQNRIRINTAINGREPGDVESRALERVEVYKRLVEGPVRQYAWAGHRLGSGTWVVPPTLTPVREALVAAGGWYGFVASTCLLTDLRNGDAHETLEWDGLSESYLVEGTSFRPEDVDQAVVLADSFARGCEAALTAFRAGAVTPSFGPPTASDPGRLPSWRRAEAFFGTNGITVTRATFNSSTAVICVASFVAGDINPCLQALTGAQALLPEVEAYEVRVGSDPVAVIRVSAEALRLTAPVWHQSIAILDRTPFSVFLPANLDARLQHEPSGVAARSIAWIAADDILDALDGTPEVWRSSEVRLFLTRLGLVESSLTRCLSAMHSDRVRPEAVLRCTKALMDLVGRLDSVPHVIMLERIPALVQIRSFWDNWGPVARMPGVPMTGAPAGYVEPRPLPHLPPADLRYRTL